MTDDQLLQRQKEKEDKKRMQKKWENGEKESDVDSPDQIESDS